MELFWTTACGRGSDFGLREKTGINGGGLEKKNIRAEAELPIYSWWLQACTKVPQGNI